MYIESVMETVFGIMTAFSLILSSLLGGGYYYYYYYARAAKGGRVPV
jgi:hypothetical protein